MESDSDGIGELADLSNLLFGMLNIADIRSERQETRLVPAAKKEKGGARIRDPHVTTVRVGSYKIQEVEADLDYDTPTPKIDEYVMHNVVDLVDDDWKSTIVSVFNDDSECHEIEQLLEWDFKVRPKESFANAPKDLQVQYVKDVHKAVMDAEDPIAVWNPSKATSFILKDNENGYKHLMCRADSKMWPNIKEELRPWESPLIKECSKALDWCSLSYYVKKRDDLDHYIGSLCHAGIDTYFIVPNVDNVGPSGFFSLDSVDTNAGYPRYVISRKDGKVNFWSSIPKQDLHDTASKNGFQFNCISFLQLLHTFAKPSWKFKGDVMLLSSFMESHFSCYKMSKHCPALKDHDLFGRRLLAYTPQLHLPLEFGSRFCSNTSFWRPSYSRGRFLLYYDGSSIGVEDETCSIRFLDFHNLKIPLGLYLCERQNYASSHDHSGYFITPYDTTIYDAIKIGLNLTDFIVVDIFTIGNWFIRRSLLNVLSSFFPVAVWHSFEDSLAFTRVCEDQEVNSIVLVDPLSCIYDGLYFCVDGKRVFTRGDFLVSKVRYGYMHMKSNHTMSRVSIDYYIRTCDYVDLGGEPVGVNEELKTNLSYECRYKSIMWEELFVAPIFKFIRWGMALSLDKYFFDIMGRKKKDVNIRSLCGDSQFRKDLKESYPLRLPISLLTDDEVSHLHQLRKAMFGELMAKFRTELAPNYLEHVLKVLVSSSAIMVETVEQLDIPNVKRTRYDSTDDMEY
jgi:hypothetical protein